MKLAILLAKVLFALWVIEFIVCAVYLFIVLNIYLFNQIIPETNNHSHKKIINMQEQDDEFHQLKYEDGCNAGVLAPKEGG